MEKSKNISNQFAFNKTNYILLIAGLIFVVLGFILMMGPGTTETHFEEDIFSVLRIKVAPTVTFLGYVFLIVAILYNRKQKNDE